MSFWLPQAPRAVAIQKDPCKGETPLTPNPTVVLLSGQCQLKSSTMIAKVNFINDIPRALAYGENQGKGGEILLQSGIISDEPPERKAERWERMSNDYKHKLAHIILSFSDADTHTLRSLPEEKRVSMEQSMVREFIRAAAEKGNNIDDCPFVCYHHGNTDNEHLHLYVLMTTWEGKRLKTGFLGKNATRAAARVSIKWDMEGPERAMKAELKHMLKTGAITPEQVSEALRQERQKERERRHHEMSDDLNVIQERLRRQQAAKEADKHKRKYAYIVTQAAATGNREAFIAKLAEDGVQFFIDQDPKKGFSIRFTEDGKERTYSFRQLGLMKDIAPFMEPPKVEKPKIAAKTEQPKMGVAKAESSKVSLEAGNSHDRASTIKAVAPPEKSSGATARLRKPSGKGAPKGGSRDDNREYEVGDNEGYEEGIRKRGGYSR